MKSVSPTFFYTEFTARNHGVVNFDEQEKLRTSHVFICGIGGAGGAALQSLVRMGIENFTIADIDVFEVSNLNHQVFATMDTVGTEKTDAAIAGIRAINPHANVKAYGGDWPKYLQRILLDADIVINGMDDVAETTKLYRACRENGRTIIDAYTAPLPNVFVTRAGEPVPEERLQYPTLGKAPEEWSREDLTGAVQKEAEYVLECSSSRRHVDDDTLAKMVSGKRTHGSFAPAIVLTGNLMAYEVANALLKKPAGVTNEGYFFNPYTGKTERPNGSLLQRIRRRAARREISKLRGEQ